MLNWEKVDEQFEKLRRSRFARFARTYTEGATGAEFRRLFQRDAKHAWTVLTRDQHLDQQDKKPNLFKRAKFLFLGMSSKLTPARRVLFAGAIGAAMLGLFKFQAVVNEARIRVDFSPLWFGVAVAALVFLLALELVDRVLVRDELEVARELQRDLLPKVLPAVEGYAWAHSYRTANDIGGDYYDVLRLPDGRLAIAVGDASGHGMAAGLLMAIANAVLKLAVDVDPAPERVASLVNRALWRTGDRRAFMSLFYATLDPASGEMRYICAGHPFPLLRRADGAIVELGRGAFPLGVRDALDVTVESAVIAPGETLLMYSDGLTESANAAGAAFGFERPAALLAHGGTAPAIHDRLLVALDAHRAGEPLADDVSIVVLSRGVRLA